MFSSKQPVFLGESYRFSPEPLQKTTFQHFQPRNIPTHTINLEKVSYPYTNMRFDHLRAFHIPHSKLDHPYAKHLKVDPYHKENYNAEVEHLGIKKEMEKGSRPNEVKLQMGLDKNENIKDFAIDNLQESAGTETKLTRHRDETVFEGTTTLPFEARYKKFLEEKEKMKTHNKPIDEKQNTIQRNPDLSDTFKERLTKTLDKKK